MKIHPVGGGGRVVVCGRVDSKEDEQAGRHDAAIGRCSQFFESANNNIFKMVVDRLFEMTITSYSRVTSVFHLLVESEYQQVILNKTCPMFADHSD
jgi:hypothetical protein